MLLLLCCCVPDVDECEDPLQCLGQECINSQGSYRCLSCQPGFRLLNRRCTGKHTCRPSTTRSQRVDLRLFVCQLTKRRVESNVSGCLLTESPSNMREKHKQRFMEGNEDLILKQNISCDLLEKLLLTSRATRCFF